MPDEFQLNIILNDEVLEEIEKIRKFLELPSSEDVISVAVSLLKAAVDGLKHGNEIGFYSQAKKEFRLYDLKGRVGEEFTDTPSPVHPYSLN